MNSHTESTIASVVNSYIDAWNTPEDQRVDAVRTVFANDGYYCDGAAEVTGADAIAAMIGATFTQFPGASIKLDSPVDAHHRQGRFAWRLENAEGATIIDGIDVIRVDDSGRLTQVLGFFGTEIPEGTSTSVETFSWDRSYPVSARRLFDVVADNAIFAKIAPNLTSIDPPPSLEAGAVRTCHDAAGATWTETYTDWVDGERFATRVDINTYPEEMKAMIKALDASWTVTSDGPDASSVSIEVTAELSDTGVQVFSAGAGADAIFAPMLDGWAAHLEGQEPPR